MNRLACTSSLVALIVAAAPAAAQTSAAPADDNRPADAATATSTASATNPADIVVTAPRRSERPQYVPISVTASTQADLTEKGLDSFGGLAGQTPGVWPDRRSENNTG